MAQTQQQLQESLDSLNEALGSGALVVKHGDTQITYRSVAELKAAIAEVTAQMNALGGVGRKPRYAVQYSKGH